jgi:hypothetical protein
MSEQNANQMSVSDGLTFRIEPSKTEILRFDHDGSFYVRGQRVPSDQEEGLRVYQAFVDWMKSAGMFK